MIELKDLTKCYKKNNLKVLENINYKFIDGKLYYIYGKSGGGKSTLIKMIGLLLKPTAGSIFINGIDTSKMKDSKKADLRNNNIGFVFQSFYLNPYLKVKENILLPTYVNKNKVKQKRLDNLLKTLGIEERVNHYPKELSGGEAQRVAVARALINNPNIILADEPTGNLDKENEKVILEILKKLAQEGKCVIVVSHSDALRSYADVILKIENHKLVEESK